MKKMTINYFIRLFCITILFGCFSCGTEPLTDLESLEAHSSSESSKKTNNKSSSITFDLSQDCDVTNRTDLFAGQNILVGDISVSVNGDNYTITYNITNSGYCLTSTHLSVVESPELFPMSNSGNPKNGHFEYSSSHDCVSSFSYTVPTSKGSYIAAHAVVNCIAHDNTEDLTVNLPELINVCVTAKGIDAVDSYFNINISDTSLQGEYDAWCIDIDRSLPNGHCFEANVYSSLNNVPAGFFENPDTFDSINWIINQGFIGQESPSGGNYTFGDVQWAIWELIDNENCIACAYLGDDWSTTKGLEIYNLAVDNGDGYIPGCGELFSVILIPTDNSQPIFITLPITCDQGECEETAWGNGCDFPGNNWATYFHYSGGAE